MSSVPTLPVPSSKISPITIGLLVVIVILIGAMIYMYFNPKTITVDAEPIDDISNCETSTPTAAQCEGIGYSVTSLSASPITTSTKYCTSLASNIALYASNVAAYYSNFTIMKSVLGNGGTTIFYKSTTRPTTNTIGDITTWVATATKPYIPIDDLTLIETSSKAMDLFNAPHGAIPMITSDILGTTTTTGFTAPTTIWINPIQDSSGQNWTILDSTKLAAAVVTGMKTHPSSNYTLYCN